MFFSDWAGHECREQDVPKVGHREYRGSICSEQRDNQSMKKYEVLPDRSMRFVITVILRVKTGPPEASMSHYVNRNNLGGYFGPSLWADSRRRGGRRGCRGGRGGPDSGGGGRSWPGCWPASRGGGGGPCPAGPRAGAVGETVQRVTVKDCLGDAEALKHVRNSICWAVFTGDPAWSRKLD